MSTIQKSEHMLAALAAETIEDSRAHAKAVHRILCRNHVTVPIRVSILDPAENVIGILIRGIVASRPL